MLKLDETFEVLNCFNCNWTFPVNFSSNKILDHINLCIDGYGKENIMFHQKNIVPLLDQFEYLNEILSSANNNLLKDKVLSDKLKMATYYKV